MVLNLVLRNNQVEISKLNTGPLLAEVLVNYRNSKKHPQNQNNQKELHLWNKNISVHPLKLKQNSGQKVLENQKNKEH